MNLKWHVNATSGSFISVRRKSKEIKKTERINKF